MSRHGTLLPLPDDPRFTRLRDLWPDWFEPYPHPRSIWLGTFERILSELYPQSSSADRKLTARHYAPFPLAQGPNVP